MSITEPYNHYLLNKGMSKWFAQGNASSDSEDDGGERVHVDKEMNRIRNMARDMGSDSE